MQYIIPGQHTVNASYLYEQTPLTTLTTQRRDNAEIKIHFFLIILFVLFFCYFHAFMFENWIKHMNIELFQENAYEVVTATKIKEVPIKYKHHPSLPTQWITN